MTDEVYELLHKISMMKYDLEDGLKVWEKDRNYTSATHNNMV